MKPKFIILESDIAKKGITVYHISGGKSSIDDIYPLTTTYESSAVDLLRRTGFSVDLYSGRLDSKCFKYGKQT